MDVHLRRLVQVFVALGDKSYARANILNLRVMKYHQDHPELPFHKMINQDIGAFDEEAGEIAFACLGRATLGDHTRDKLKHCHKMWRTISIFDDRTDFLDAANVRSKKSLRKTITECSDVLVDHFVER
jgi:hypothetical protein